MTGLTPIQRDASASVPADNAPTSKTKYAPHPAKDVMESSLANSSSSNTASADKRSICTKFCDCITSLFNKFIACLKNLFCCSNTKPSESPASSKVSDANVSTTAQTQSLQNNPAQTTATGSTTITRQPSHQPQPLTDEQIKNITQEEFLTLTQAQISALTPSQAKELEAKANSFLRSIGSAIDKHPNYRQNGVMEAAALQAEHLKQPALKLLQAININPQPNDTTPFTEILGLLDQQQNANDAWGTQVLQPILLPWLQIVLQTLLELKKQFLAKGDANADAIRIHELTCEYKEISTSVFELNLNNNDLIACLQGAKGLIPQEIITSAETLPDSLVSWLGQEKEHATLYALFNDPPIILNYSDPDTNEKHYPPAELEKILRENILPFARQVQKLAQEEANKIQQLLQIGWQIHEMERNEVLWRYRPEYILPPDDAPSTVRLQAEQTYLNALKKTKTDLLQKNDDLAALIRLHDELEKPYQDIDREIRALRDKLSTPLCTKQEDWLKRYQAKTDFRNQSLEEITQGANVLLGPAMGAIIGNAQPQIDSQLRLREYLVEAPTQTLSNQTPPLSDEQIRQIMTDHIIPFAHERLRLMQQYKIENPGQFQEDLPLFPD